MTGFLCSLDLNVGFFCSLDSDGRGSYVAWTLVMGFLRSLDSNDRVLM